MTGPEIILALLAFSALCGFTAAYFIVIVSNKLKRKDFSDG